MQLLRFANIIRTDAPVHRPLPADTDLAQAAAHNLRDVLADQPGRFIRFGVENGSVKRAV